MSIYNHHLVYKTTNCITGKIYIGVHSTNDPDDSYLGSGINIIESIKKYGKDNFTKEVLFDFPTRKEASDKEKELVTEEFVLRQDTYNASTGGIGYTGDYKRGKDHHMYGNVPSEETRRKLSEGKKGKNNPMYGVSLSGEKHWNYGKTGLCGKKVSVNGVIYNSCREAAKAVGKSEGTFNYWLKKGKAYYV